MRCGAQFIDAGFSEVILPAIAEPDVWYDRSGREIEGQMWTFDDKGNRPCALIPEATALLQREYRERWGKSLPKPIRVFYEQRCYRYERPQAGRYREFTQFGIEVLGPDDYEDECRNLLKTAITSTGVACEYDFDAVRGLSYYSRNGFEARVDALGAQKQVAGGGSYENGCGWAIGIDRLTLAKMKQDI